MLTFMTSMYFFVPLGNQVHRRYKELLNQQGNPVNVPQYVTCQSVSIRYLELNEDKHSFYFNVIGKSTPCGIDVKFYLLKCSFGSNQKYPFYLIAVGSDIDKYFIPINQIPQICEPSDFVLLKKAFYNKGTHGLFFPAYNPTSFFGDHLKSVVAKITCNPTKAVRLNYSLTDIRSASVTAKLNIDKDFLDNYFSVNPININTLFSFNYRRWAYGLLNADDNYDVIDIDTLGSAFVFEAPSLESERFFSANNHLVFLRCRYPFGDREEKRKIYDTRPFFFSTLPHITEICISIYTDLQLQTIYRKILVSNNANSIRKTRSLMITQLNAKMFHLASLDKKLQFIYCSWGFEKRRREIDVIGALHAESIGIKLNENMNWLVIGLTALTVIFGAISIFKPNSTDMLSLYCSCNNAVRQSCCGDGDRLLYVLLVLILICLVIIAVTTIISICQRCKIKDLLKDYTNNDTCI